MSDLDFIKMYLNDEPQAAAGETKGAAEEFLNKPVSGSAVTVQPGKALPEEPKAAEAPKTFKQTTKEKLMPQVRKVADTKEKAETILGAAVPDVSAVPVPTGGIGLLLFLALLVVFAITPFNGKSGASRLSLLWGTMLGNYSISKTSAPSSSGKSSGGSAPALPSAGGGMDALIQGGLYT